MSPRVKHSPRHPQNPGAAKICRRDVVVVAAEFIEANYDRPIRLADLAWETQLSVSRIAHLFRQDRGMSPMQYVTHVRLAHAKRLLTTTDLELQRVADMVGFRSPAYFGRVFKKRLGVSPGRYRLLAWRNDNPYVGKGAV